MDKLMAMLKIIDSNLGMLHRNLLDENWFSVHAEIEGFNAKISSIKDDIIEICISQGYVEPSLEESIKLYPELPVMDRNAFDSYTCIKDMFIELIDELNKAKGSVTPDIASEWDSYQYWIRKTVEYKLMRAITCCTKQK